MIEIAKDFLKDFRFHDDRDNQDRPFEGKCPEIEFSDCNRENLLQEFNSIKENAKAILEIGVCRNGLESSTHVFLNNKKKETKYVGIDLEDKSSLNDAENNVHTFKIDSNFYKEIQNKCFQLQIYEYDFIFIDGWHSIEQCIADWRFVAHLSKNGVVGLHDTTKHPGPFALVENINKDIWDVKKLCLEDNGISFFRKK